MSATAIDDSAAGDYNVAVVYIALYLFANVIYREVSGRSDGPAAWG